MPALRETIVVVTGTTRGAGKGIALALGEAGATVYVTSRSTHSGGTTLDYPGTIEETAEAVSARGGVAIPVRVDHSVESEVEALFARVQAEHGRRNLAREYGFRDADGRQPPACQLDARWSWFPVQDWPYAMAGVGV